MRFILALLILVVVGASVFATIYFSAELETFWSTIQPTVVSVWDYLNTNLPENWIWWLGGFIGLLLLRRFYKRWYTKREENPIAIGPLRSIVITGTLAFATGALFGWLVAWLATVGNVFPAFGLLYWATFGVLTVGIGLMLLMDKRTLGPNRNDDADQQMLPVPENHAAILTWIRSRIRIAFLLEGAVWIPWWLLFSVSRAPVSTTKVQLHDENGRPTDEVDKGHFTPLEAVGYVFMGKRTIQEVVAVQAADKVKVVAETDGVIKTKNPIRWQGANNPFGTMIGRLEASLRTAIAKFYSEDANDVRSLFPSLLLGTTVLYVKARGKETKGRLVRDSAETPLAWKVDYYDEGRSKRVYAWEDDRSNIIASANTLADLKRQFAEKLNSMAGLNYTPSGKRIEPATGLEVKGYTSDMVDSLTVSAEYKETLDAYGAFKELMALKDISLPVGVEEAFASVVIERAQRKGEVIQAETAALVAAVHKRAIDKSGKDAAQMAMIDREKATAVAGWGDNPIAQAIAAFRGATP